MNYQQARSYLLSKPEAREDFPFGPEVAVFKIKDKMFATLNTLAKSYETSKETSMNLKCDPQEALMLRDIFSAVKPGYHMNKRHWNTIIFDSSIPEGEIARMVDDSYALVVKGLTKKLRTPLEIQYSREQLYGPVQPLN
ncbi:MAG: putative DNA-binding protein (MmcQ/YjbR family) [Oceanospirillaceae bacterium]|jgi:predicted DNA-binding protein (MmcQ/YjbR family)